VRAKPLPRKAVQSLVMPDGGDIATPRWTPDGKAIVFAHRAPDAEGFLHFDLYRWDFQQLTRLTRLADVRDADPLPDGHTAVAVRSRNGMSQLVTVDLSAGGVTPRGTASIDVVETHPRVSPDGARVAHVAHRGGRWTLFVDDTPVTVPGDPASPEWIGTDELLVTVFSGGFAELYRVRLGGEATQVTRSGGGAFASAPARDGRVFFMSLDPDGYVVRVLDDVAPTPPSPLRASVADTALVPAIPPQPRAAAVFASQPVTARLYGIGRQELSWFTATNFAPEHRSFEAGVRLGDVVGRLDTIVAGAVGRDDAPGGVALATAWRGWPVELQAHAFATNADAPDHDDRGVELRATWSRVFPLSRLTVDGGALSDDRLFGSGAFSTRQLFGAARLEEALRVDIDDAHYRGIASAAYRTSSWRIAARYQHDGGDRVTLGGLASTILPRSAYALRVLDPALPVAILAGDDYDGWRVESTVPFLPFTAFYQRHELGGTRLSIAGGEVRLSSEADPILKVPGLDLTLGVAYVFDAPLERETKWWLGMRWRP
jgi:hypothetical protein